MLTLNRCEPTYRGRHIQKHTHSVTKRPLSHYQRNNACGWGVSTQCTHVTLSDTDSYTKALNGECFCPFSVFPSWFSVCVLICNKQLLIWAKISMLHVGVFMRVCAPPRMCPPASSSRHTWWWWAHGSACGRHTCTLEAQHQHHKITISLQNVTLSSMSSQVWIEREEVLCSAVMLMHYCCTERCIDLIGRFNIRANTDLI